MKSINAGTVVLLDYHESGHYVRTEKGYRIIREWTCEHCNRETGDKTMREEMEKHAEFSESTIIANS